MKKVKCLRGVAIPGLESYALSLFALRPSHLPSFGEAYICSDSETILLPDKDCVQCSDAIIDARVYGPAGVGFISLMSESKRLLFWAFKNQYSICEASQPYAQSATSAGFIVPVSLYSRKIKFTFLPTDDVKGTYAKGRLAERVLSALLKPRLIEQINNEIFPEKTYVAHASDLGIDFRSNGASPFYLPATSCHCDKKLSEWEVFLEFAERKLYPEEREDQRAAQKRWKAKSKGAVAPVTLDCDSERVLYL